MSRNFHRVNISGMVLGTTAITATIYAVIATIAQAIVGITSYLLALHNAKYDKKAQKQEKMDAADKKIDQACNEGSLSDLLDATKQKGDARK